MSRLLVTSRYLKGGSKNAKNKRSNYTKYIATRETVETRDTNDPSSNCEATQKQKNLINDLLKEFPDSKLSLEYEDYKAKPTTINASEFINSVMEKYADAISNRENFVGYMAMRPGAERRGQHGLFNEKDEPINLNQVAKEVSEHPGNVWSHVISLRREDAARLGYNNSEAWRQLVLRHINDIAEASKIPILNEIVAEFERQCQKGTVCDGKQTFQQYAEYAMKIKERRGVKHSTLVRYRQMLKDIYKEIGYVHLVDIKPQMLNQFYESLEKGTARKTPERATPKVDFKQYLKKRKITQEMLHKKSGVGMMTIRSVISGENILFEKAQVLCETLGVPLSTLFKCVTDERGLSSKTICEYHRLISSILALADKEMIIPFNPASKATPPRSKRKKVNYFDYDEVEKIVKSLKDEPIKWQTLVNLLLITGARRGEIVGLKWDAIDWEKNRIFIHVNLLYSTDRGIYEDTTKTEESERYIALPEETMEMLRAYRKWYIKTSTEFGSRWNNTGFLFFQDKSGNEGKPMHPDTVNQWLRSFAQRHGLGHINPHAFRHTMASLLLHGNMDIGAISKRLGHAKISTTLDIYSHILKESDEQSAETIADIVLRKEMA